MGNKNHTLLNLIGLAEELQLPAKWLKEQAKADKIPCLFIGRRKIRFNLEAVKEVLADMAARGERGGHAEK